MAKRPSPDSVICIDLTESDDEREKKLEDVRKRLKGTPAATTVKLEGAARAPTTNTTSNDDNDGGGKIRSCASIQQQRWKGEVEIVEPAAPEIHAVAPAAAQASDAATGNDDDDVMLVGTANESRLPHMRQHCPDNKFVQDVVSLNRRFDRTTEQIMTLNEGQHGNPKCCDLCYCFVCDKKASECTSWGSTCGFSSHCHASDTGVDATKWKRLREKAKTGGTPAAPALPPAPPVPPPPTLIGPGPFAPDNTLAASASDLTKCRKCGWFNRFDHRNFEKLRVDAKTQGTAPDLHPVGFLDWCQSCGRVASEKDFGKLQAQPYVRQGRDVFLGLKTIPFTIVAHDPRNFDRYKDKWAANDGSDPNWTFSHAEMQEDVFKHRLGQYPLLPMILASIPTVSQSKIPKTGSFYMQKGGFLLSTSRYYGVRRPLKECASADETDAVIVEDDNDCNLLEELYNFGSVGCKTDAFTANDSNLDGDITASWDATTGSGVSCMIQEVRCIYCSLY